MEESAKLRALRAKNVLTGRRVLHGYVATCQRVWRGYVLTFQRALRALVLTSHCALSAYVPHMSTCLACLCTHVSTLLASSRAHVPPCLPSLASQDLCDHLPTCYTYSVSRFDAAFFSFAAIVDEVAHTVGKV